jgi:hypothetical protein
MQTTGACQVGTSPAGSQRCLRSYMRAVVRPVAARRAYAVTPTYVPMQNLGGLGGCCPSYASSERRFWLASTVALGLELPTQTSGGRLRGRPSWPEYCRPTFACADNERRFGLAHRVAVDLELPTQTSGERLRDRPSCPTRCHLTSVAGHVIATRPSCSLYSIIPPFAARWPGRRCPRSSR